MDTAAENIQQQDNSNRDQGNAVQRQDKGRDANPLFETDEFRLKVFKIALCTKRNAHDWTACPFAHPGERATRRDPAIYAAVMCPDMRNGECPRGMQCHLAHSVFEYWLHPTRYRTCLCRDGSACTRSVCFFAHNLHELRAPASASPHAPNSTSTSSSPSSAPVGPQRLLQMQHSSARLPLLPAAAGGSRNVSPEAVDLSSLVSTNVNQQGTPGLPEQLLSGSTIASNSSSSNRQLLQAVSPSWGSSLLPAAMSAASTAVMQQHSNNQLSPCSSDMASGLTSPLLLQQQLQQQQQQQLQHAFAAAATSQAMSPAASDVLLSTLIAKQRQHQEQAALAAARADALLSQLQAIVAAASASGVTAGGADREIAARTGAAAGAGMALQQQGTAAPGRLVLSLDPEAPSSLLLQSPSFNQMYQALLTPSGPPAAQPAGLSAVFSPPSPLVHEQQQLLEELKSLQLQQQVQQNAVFGPGAAPAGHFVPVPAAAALREPTGGGYAALQGTIQQQPILLKQHRSQPELVSSSQQDLSSITLLSGMSSTSQLLSPLGLSTLSDNPSSTLLSSGLLLPNSSSSLTGQQQQSSGSAGWW